MEDKLASPEWLDVCAVNETSNMEVSPLDLCRCVQTEATGPPRYFVMCLSPPSHLETLGLLSPNLVLLILCLRTHFFVLAACPYNRLLRIVLRLLQISQPHIASHCGG